MSFQGNLRVFAFQMFAAAVGTVKCVQSGSGVAGKRNLAIRTNAYSLKKARLNATHLKQQTFAEHLWYVREQK